MKEFIELRRKAREKRDRAIGQARKDYSETLVRIAALEQDLLGRDLSSHKQISACIDRVIPTDREFTTVDIMTALEALDSARTWRKRSVDSHISRLRERGLVRRVRKARKTEPAIYARAGVKTAPRAFEGQTLKQVIEGTLAGGAMTQTELAVAMLEAGYETTMTPRAFRTAVGVVLRGNAGRFRQESVKWGVAE